MKALKGSGALTVRPFERRDLSALRTLTYYNFHVHTHLDWQTVDDYLHTIPEYLWVACRGGRIVGAMGISEPIDGICWLRIVVAEDTDQPDNILNYLWETIREPVLEIGVETISVLLLRDWLQLFIQQVDFHYVEDIITLQRYKQALPEATGTPPEIHLIEMRDLEIVQQIDNAAFQKPWQLSLSEVRLGVRIGAYNTIAVQDGDIIGYQITTMHGTNGHLARLGIFPHLQGQGIGGWILRDMLKWFSKHNVDTITVNTQASNLRSQRLYERYGFQRNGYDLPVWSIQIR